MPASLGHPVQGCRVVGPGLISLQHLGLGSGLVPGAEVLPVAALVRPLVAIFRAWDSESTDRKGRGDPDPQTLCEYLLVCRKESSFR